MGHRYRPGSVKGLITVDSSDLSKIVGYETDFANQLYPGDFIVAEGQKRVIKEIGKQRDDEFLYVKLSGDEPTYNITNIAMSVNDSDAATKAFVNEDIPSGAVMGFADGDPKTG